MVNAIRIFDMNGRLVMQITSTEIDVRDLSAGQYMLNIHNGKEIVSRKFIKK